MKTTIGGDRLGSGNKQEVSLRNYNRSTHDLSYTWRSSMSSGTLVPFMNQLCLPGDSFDIDLNVDVKTLPTIGPLFGSYKIQLDVFEVPMRLFQGKLHMNALNIGMDMSKIKLPQFKMLAEWNKENEKANAQVSPSSIYSYLGVNGLGRSTSAQDKNIEREFNAVPLLGYWSIYKNYYANKMESDAYGPVGYYVHQEDWTNEFDLTQCGLYTGYVPGVGGQLQGYIDLTNNLQISVANQGAMRFTCIWNNQTNIYGHPDIENLKVQVKIGPSNTWVTKKIYELFGSTAQVAVINIPGSQGQQGYVYDAWNWVGGGNGNCDFKLFTEEIDNTDPAGGGHPQVRKFNLENIDNMRESILAAVQSPNAFLIDHTSDAPYGPGLDTLDGAATEDYNQTFCRSQQEGLGIKTYQSDLNNNFIDTQFIDGTTGVANVSAVLVDTNATGDAVVKMDALNLAQKVYNMLNRIAVSGGTYDDWLDAVYTHERARAIESPVYHGSLIKELAFQEVVSNADTMLPTQNGGINSQPLGTLAGRGKLTGKHKGGRMRIKTHEHGHLIGIISVTPKIDYSQGNDTFMNLKNMGEFHMPELSAIGFEDKITDTMAWFDTEINPTNGKITWASSGKQPAWINYMSAVNRCHGNFADTDKEMYMTLNRRYEFDGTEGIKDLTTYIDPSKYNHIFADTSLSSQNFWSQIAVRNIARRKMSAKLIPNL